VDIIQSRLAEKRILVADGAWGTELARRGLPVGEAPEKWGMDHPDAVRDVARQYVEAGADIILTNTFGGSAFKLAKIGLGMNTHAINATQAQLSTEIAHPAGVLVAGSIGPTGEFMQPLGLVSEEDMVAAFAEQVRGLADGGVDAILIETMSDLGETKAALQAARENFAGPVICSMTFDHGPGGYATMMGVRPAQAAQDLEAAGADIVGSNCGAGIANIIEVIAAMRPATDLPLWAKPNAGMPELVGGQTVFKETPEQMAARFADLVAAGANIIGGCCGTTPAHIAALVAERDRLVG